MNERCIKQGALELSRHVIFHSLVVITVLAITYTTMQSSLAQNDSVTTPSDPNRSIPNIEIIHRPFESSAIPAVGTLMRLSVELANTYDIETKVRLVGSKDNRFIDIAFPRGALNNLDRPTFSVEIPSPIAAMTYQFIVHQRDGSLTSSRKFLLKRTKNLC